MDIIIRPVKFEDAADLHAVRTMKGVYESLLSLPGERLADMEAYLKSLTSNSTVLVAETDGRAIACAGLDIVPRLRSRHTASVGIMIHAEFQGKGIGTSLMRALLDIADNWLMLKRVELDVYVTNQRAIKLYKRMGFVIEGTKKYAAVCHGEFCDVYLMARCRE